MFERFRLFRQEPKEVTIDDLTNFLNDNFKDEKKEVESKLGSIAQEIGSNFTSVKNIATELKTKSSPNRYANVLKDKFCDKIIQTVDSLRLNSSDYDSMKEFVRLAHASMQSIGSMGLKEFKHLHAFRDDMSKIAEKMKVLEYNMKSASKIIQDSRLSKIDTIKSDTDEIFRMRKKIDHANKEILEMAKSKQPINDAIEQEKRRIEETNSQLAEYAAERLKIRELEKSLENIKQQVNHEFAGMDRIMKKFVYFGELTKEQIGVLKEYIKEPGTTFLEKDENNLIRSILDAIHGYKDKEMIDLDERKLEKLKDIIRQSDFLLGLRDHYKDVRQKKEDMENQLVEKSEPLKQSIKLSMMEIANREKELGTLRSKIDSKNIEKNLLEKQLIDIRSRIELNLSNLLGNQIRLV